jgi:hypothetical protein
MIQTTNSSNLDTCIQITRYLQKMPIPPFSFRIIEMRTQKWLTYIILKIKLYFIVDRLKMHFAGGT